MPTSLYGKQRKSLLEPGQDNFNSPQKIRDKGKSFDVDPEVYEADMNDNVSGLHSQKSVIKSTFTYNQGDKVKNISEPSLKISISQNSDSQKVTVEAVSYTHLRAHKT